MPTPFLIAYLVGGFLFFLLGNGWAYNYIWDIVGIIVATFVLLCERGYLLVSDVDRRRLWRTETLTVVALVVLLFTVCQVAKKSRQEKFKEMDTVSGGSYYGTDIVGEKIGVIECGNDSLFRLVEDYYWSKNNDGFPAYMEVMAEVYGNWWLFSNLEEETEDDRCKADYRRKYCDAYRHKLLADSLENIPLKREEPCKDYLNRRHYVELVETGDTALFALRFDGLMAHPNSQAYCWIMANVYGRPQVVDRAYGYYLLSYGHYYSTKLEGLDYIAGKQN